jgi:flagellar biosynthesis/type III secretory pathway protein FliH
MPVNLVQQRGKETPPTAAAERAAQRHYEKLAAIVAGDVNPVDCFPFNQPEYEDVRNVYEQAAKAKRIAEKKAAEQEALEPLAVLFESLELDFQEDAIRSLIDRLGLDISEIAEDEIQAAREEGEEEGYEDGLQSGYESASEDMYSIDYHNEEVEREVAEAKEEWEANELEDARAEAYESGWRDGKQDKAPEFDFVSGMPSFLL